MTRPNIVPLNKLALDWDLPVAWLRRHVDAGNIPHIRIHRRVYINPDAASEAIERLAGCAPVAAEVDFSSHPTLPGMGEKVDVHG